MWNYLTQDIGTYLTKHHNSYALNCCCSFLVLMLSQCPLWSCFFFNGKYAYQMSAESPERRAKHSVGKNTGGCTQSRSTAFYKFCVLTPFWLLFRQLFFALLKHILKRQILGKIWFVEIVFRLTCSKISRLIKLVQFLLLIGQTILAFVQQDLRFIIYIYSKVVICLFFLPAA